MRGLLPMFAACLLVGSTAQSLAQAVAATRYYKVVARGGRIEMDHLFDLDPTCRSMGTTTVNLLTAPRGGSVEVGMEHRFPNYTQANVRSRCDTRRTPATALYYHARPDFVGVDTFVAELVFPEGYARKVRYAIAVR